MKYGFVMNRKRDWYIDSRIKCVIFIFVFDFEIYDDLSLKKEMKYILE